MKTAILGLVHDDGLEFLKNKNFEVLNIENLEVNNLKKELSDVDAILLRTSKLTREILSECKKLKIIARHGVGYDNVDVDYLNEKKIALAITSTANSVSVAEHVLSFFIYLTKKFDLADKLVRDGKFKLKSTLPNFFELYQKKVLICGYGRIGKEVAKRCNGFDMNIYIYDPFVDDKEISKYGYTPIGKEEGLELADYVTIHLPLNDKTKNFIDKEELKKMKNTSILVNTSRGGIINENALFNALNTRNIKSAGIDVFENEPPIADHPFFQLDNILLTPHNAALTLECRKRMAIEAAENIYFFLNYKNKVNSQNLVNHHLFI